MRVFTPLFTLNRIPAIRTVLTSLSHEEPVPAENSVRIELTSFGTLHRTRANFCHFMIGKKATLHRGSRTLSYMEFTANRPSSTALRLPCTRDWSSSKNLVTVFAKTTRRERWL